MKAQPKGSRWEVIWLATLVLCMARVVTAGAVSSPSEKFLFNIDAGVAAVRLNEFGTQSGMQLVFNFEDMQGVDVAAVHGEFKPFEALKVMLKGTDITYQFVNRRTLTFQRTALEVPPPKATAKKLHGARHPDDWRSPTADMAVVKISSVHESILAATGSPLLTMDRTDIDSTGYVTVQGVLRTLPQIFGGGPTEDTSQGSEARTNISHGTGVNLRGLGAGSTLVVMNGHRLAGSGTEGLFVDVSNLPLIAIERIEILPDSSSTYLGSDAAGGVANFVMRDDFKGRQTEAYFGNSTRGGLNENYVSQLVGMHTESGHGVLALDFYSRDNLQAADREMARSDLREYGGSNFDTSQSNPGNIVIGNTSWAIPSGQDGMSLTPSSFKAGTQNLSNQWEGADVLPTQQRWSMFGSWQQHLTQSLTLFGDAIFSQRDMRGDGNGQSTLLRVPDTNGFYVNPTGGRGPITVQYNFLDDLGPLLTKARVQDVDTTAGLEFQFDSGWRITGSAGYASERIGSRIDNQVNTSALNAALALSDRSVAFNPFGDGSHTNPDTLDSLRAYSALTHRSTLTSAGLRTTGPLAELPGGDLELTFGGDVRRQSFASTIYSNSPVIPTDVRNEFDRSIHAGFAELRVPIFGPQNRHRALEALSISLAERYERYSDFGSNLSGRLGLSWAPVTGLTVRSTYSESFRPPGLLDLDESNNAYAFTQLRDPQTGGVSTVMLLAGKNRDLREENARSWTAGLELEPPALPGAALAITYFSTDFTDRLTRPAFTADILSNPALSALVTRDPSAEYRADVCARSPQSGSAGNCLTAPIAAIVDLRARNDSIVETRGVDMLARYARPTSFGRLSFSLNGTYITDFAEAQAANLPLTDRVSTPSYPVNFKMRSTARWERGGWDISAYANYLNSYRDKTSVPVRRVDSWTTIDLHAAYTLDHSIQNWLGDTTFALGIDNALDADPPFLNNPVGIGYDQENGDLIGRMVSFTVRKKW